MGPQGETVYVNQFFVIRGGAVGTKHVFAGSTRMVTKLAKQENPTIKSNNAGGSGKDRGPRERDMYFYHPDHLGSSSYVTDEGGRVFQHLEYFPFGETWVEEKSNTQRTPYLFTGKELDEDTGLYYFGARYYDQRTSVWVSVDPILGSYLNGKRGMGGVFNPFNLAMYSYSHLNPVKYVDPDGNEVTTAAVIKTISAIIDYGWTAFDMVSAFVTTLNPNAKPIDKTLAKVDIALAGAFEGAEPDEISPVNLPLDDIARKGVMGALKELVQKLPKMDGVWKSINPEGFANSLKHTFSKDHIQKGLLELGSPGKIIENTMNTIVDLNKGGKLKNGHNVIHTKMNGHDATITSFFKEGEMMSFDIYKGISNRDWVKSGSNVIDLR